MVSCVMDILFHVINKTSADREKIQPLLIYEELIMDFDRAYADYLKDKDIKEIAKLEKKIGKTLLAYYTPPIASNLDDKTLEKIQELEKKLCVRLVAYETH